MDTQDRLGKVRVRDIDIDRVRVRDIDRESTAHAPSLPQDDPPPEPVKEKEQRTSRGIFNLTLIARTSPRQKKCGTIGLGTGVGNSF